MPSNYEIRGWIVGVLTILGFLAFLAVMGSLQGCKAQPAADQPLKSTPVLVDKAVAAGERADAKLAHAEPLIDQCLADNGAPASVTIPLTTVRADVGGARADLKEVVSAGQAAGKQAEKDAAASAAKDKKIEQLNAADPYRAYLFWGGCALAALAVGTGAIALFLRNQRLGELAGYFAACSITAGVAYKVLPTVEAIVKWGIIGGSVAAAVLLAWFGWQWFKAHRNFNGVVSSIQVAKDAGALLMTDAAKTILNATQSSAVQAAVRKIKGGAAPAAGSKP